MKQTVPTKSGSAGRSNAETVAGKKSGSGISRPAPDAVVQRQVLVRPLFEKHENVEMFKLATDIFLKSTTDPFLKKIEKAGDDLELVIYGMDNEGKGKDVTAGITHGTVRTTNLHEGLEDYNDFQYLNSPKKVNWDAVDKKTPFRITIGINLHPDSHRKPEDMIATLLHEWHVHGTNWAKQYHELISSDNPETIFEGYDNDTVAMQEHKDYVLGKTGIDGALGDLTKMAERFAKGEATEDEKKGEAYAYFNNNKSKARVKGIKSAVLKDIRSHEKITKEKLNRDDWENLNPLAQKKNVLAKNKQTEKRKKEDDSDEERSDHKKNRTVVRTNQVPVKDENK